MCKNNEFYEFAQDLEIDLSNRPNKFIDLESLIGQLTDVLNEHGNTKCAIVTDRHTKFTYLYTFAGEGSVITDVLYPHKGKSLVTRSYHVFVPNDELRWNEKYECDTFVTNLTVDPLKQHLYVDSRCIGDDGVEYEVVIINNKMTILFRENMDRYINMKITVIMISDMELVTDSADPKNKMYPPNPEGVCETFVEGLVRNGIIKESVAADSGTVSAVTTLLNQSSDKLSFAKRDANG